MSEANILVIGDVALECGVAIEPAERYFSGSPKHSIELGKPQQQDGRFLQLRGGAWRIEEYILAKKKKEKNIQVSSIPEPIDGSAVFSEERSPPLLFIELDLFSTEMRWNKDAKLWLSNRDEKTYRIDSTIARRQAIDSFYLTLAEQFQSPNVLNAFKNVDVLVICDRQLGFRSAVSATYLGTSLKNALIQIRKQREAENKTLTNHHPWIIVETTDPLDFDQNRLIDCIDENNLLDRTVVVLSANSLKSSGIVLRDDLSLERSVEDLISAINDAFKNENEKVMKLICKIKSFVIRLGSRAALIWTPPSEYEKGDVRLVFGSNPYEPQTCPAAESSDLGSMHGYSSILASEIAIQLARTEESESDFENQIALSCAAGLNACQRYFYAGLGKSPSEISDAVFERLWGDENKEIKSKNSDFYMVDGERARKQPGEWTILREKRRRISYSEPGEWSLEESTESSEKTEIAVEVVRKGLDVLRANGIPYVKHVNLVTADRHEIEQYSGIASLITKYMDDSKWSKPLCLGVFGPPGCGKSFGVEQVVQAITGYKPNTSVSLKTFNLSQFRNSEQLARAFHQIRDDGLSGKLPLVFIDEFDSGLDGQNYGWLKYLLAPMQDAKFLDGDTWFHLPRCILVFIGGLNRDFIEFESRLRDEEFIAAKGRDFISRLRHFLVVKGPDLAGPGEKEDEQWDGRRLRRAIILRSVLERNLSVVIEVEKESENKIIKRANIDKRVIEAFLSVESYKHGVRSLEAIVDMSRASVTRLSFQKSSLPPAGQLELHVNAKQFLDIVNAQIESSK